MRGNVLIQDLEFAVDLVIVSDSMDALGIHPSPSFGAPPRPVQLNLNQEPVELVKEFQYLGSIISHECTHDSEINSKVSKAAHTFRSLFKM